MILPQRGGPASALRVDLPSLEGHLLDAVNLVKAEYLEMPGLGLTLPQVARFFTLTTEESRQLIAVLVAEGVLVRDNRGAYRRRW